MFNISKFQNAFCELKITYKMDTIFSQYMMPPHLPPPRGLPPLPQFFFCTWAPLILLVDNYRISILFREINKKRFGNFIDRSFLEREEISEKGNILKFWNAFVKYKIRKKSFVLSRDNPPPHHTAFHPLSVQVTCVPRILLVDKYRIRWPTPIIEEEKLADISSNNRM